MHDFKTSTSLAFQFELYATPLATRAERENEVDCCYDWISTFFDLFSDHVAGCFYGFFCIRIKELTKSQIDQIEQMIDQDHVVHWELKRGINQPWTEGRGLQRVFFEQKFP